MINCVSVKQMREFDNKTINGGVSSIELMGRAAKAVFDSLDFNNKKTYIICGTGNNGGDGLALAEILFNKGYVPYVYLINKIASYDAQYYLDDLIDLGCKTIFDIKDCAYNADIIIDCIFGTGFHGEVNPDISTIIDKINNSKAKIISVDIPSGLNGENGLATTCIHANKTIAIQYIKYGHVLNDGKDYTGELFVKDIGITAIEPVGKIIESQDVAFAKRKSNANKGTYGKSIVIGGCTNYMGAVKIANLGVSALRSGAGLNILAVPKSMANTLACNVMESSVFELSEKEGHLIFNKEEINKLLSHASSVAIGMGMGDNYNENYKIIEYIVKNFDGQILIDADGLNSIQGNVQLLKQSKKGVVITPHPKEFSKLINRDVKEILSNPVEIIKEVIGDSNLTVLLKGSSSIIANKDDLYFVTNGSAALSKGGSGDTLSGVILGLLSQGFSNIKSAYTGAYLCAEAAKICAYEFSEYGVLASDVSRVIKTLIK